MNETCTSKPTEGKSNHNTKKKKYYMNIGLLMVFQLRCPEIYRKCSNIQSNLEVPCRDVGPYCISPPQTGAVFHDFPPNIFLEL
jgi:hypothetical protein